MAQTSISAEEHWQRAQELYEHELRAKVETPENIGNLIIIDVDSGDYEIEDDRSFELTHRLQARHPESILFALRIGYKTAFSFCGGPERTTPLPLSDDSCDGTNAMPGIDP